MNSTINMDAKGYIYFSKKIGRVAWELLKKQKIGTVSKSLGTTWFGRKAQVKEDGLKLNKTCQLLFCVIDVHLFTKNVYH